jgi:hypothetical protein
MCTSYLERAIKKNDEQGLGKNVQVGATAPLNVVALADVPAVTHVNQAYATGDKQGAVSQTLNVELQDKRLEKKTFGSSQ